MPELEPEDGPRDESQDGHDTVVPHKQRVRRQPNERLADRTRDSGHEQERSHDERTHVLGCLGERVLETGDGCEDLGERDEHVTAGLDPDVQVRSQGVALCVYTGCYVVAAGVGLVDVMLYDSGPDHGRGTSEKAHSDLLERREVETHASKTRVDELITDGDKDDKGEWVEVGKNVVRDTVCGHGGGLRRQVVVKLVVSEP